jgi:hypothetical protein
MRADLESAMDSILLLQYPSTAEPFIRHVALSLH